MLKEAIKIENIKFPHNDRLRGIRELKLTGALLYLIMYDYEHESYSEKEEVRKAIVDKLHFILHETGEPSFENGHNWGYPGLCQSIALLKNKKELWDLFTEEEHERLDFFMRMFLYMWNFGCNKHNWYSGTWALNGNYWKDANPNYMFVNEMELPYLMSYFGDDSNFTIINNILANFDYEAEKERMEKWGYHNALHSWTRPAVVWEDGHTWTSTKGHLTVGHVMCIPVREYGVDTYDFRGNGKGVTVPVEYTKRGSKESM